MFDFLPSPLAALESIRVAANDEVSHITDVVAGDHLKSAREAAQNVVAGAIALVIQGFASTPRQPTTNFFHGEMSRRTAVFMGGFRPSLRGSLRAPGTSTIQ